MDGGSLFEEMTDKNTSGRKLASDTQPAAKKPYLKPEFRYERAFETMALACGKVLTQFLVSSLQFPTHTSSLCF